MRSLVLILISCVATALVAEPADRPGPQVLSAGSEIKDARLGFQFRVPRKSVLRIRPRGNAVSVDVESVEVGLYLIFSTSYRIRRPENIAAVWQSATADALGSCEVPEAPAEQSFDITARCEGDIGLNSIVRHIRLVRADGWLHFFYVAIRREAAEELSAKILTHVRINAEFPDAGSAR